MKIKHLLVTFCCIILTASGISTADKPKTKPLMKDFMGVNGHFHFKPELYKQTCRLVRNYHNLNWDFKDRNVSVLPKFPMAVNRVDWNRNVYGKWKKHGLEVDASIQFGGSDGKEWLKNPKAAFAYGKAFAKYFGPSGPNKLLTSAEIGNEPTKLSDETYRAIFKQMAAGLRAGDPKLKILTATTAVVPDKWSKKLDLHVGLEKLYDVINFHKYAAAEGWPTWKRSHPEDPKIDYLTVVQNAIDWRNKKAKGKELWITEFGYDACTAAAMKHRKKPFEKWLDVTDEHQAQWIVRSFLMFSSMDVDRAYLYFFNDADKASTHAAAGLTRNFKPKPSFHAMAHLYRTLGDFRYNKAIVKKKGGLHVFEYAGANGTPRIWVVWLATGGDRSEIVTLRKLPSKPLKAERMPLKAGDAPTVKWSAKGRDIKLTITESPTYIWLRR
jgi:hypothetical protein